MSKVVFTRSEIRQLVSDCSVKAWGYRVNAHSILAGDLSRHVFVLLSAQNSDRTNTHDALAGSITDFVTSRGVSRDNARLLAFDLLLALGVKR